MTIILYASTRLGRKPSEIVPIFSVPLVMIAVANSLLPGIHRSTRWSNRTVVVLYFAIATIVPIWACLGLVFPWLDSNHRGV